MLENVLFTVTPLCDTNEINQWQNRPFINGWPEFSRQKGYRESSVTKTIKKRNKRNRTSYTGEQLKVLEHTFATSKYIDREDRRDLADSLNIHEKCIKVWFQNRRMKEKRESSESSCDSSSDYVEPITPPFVNPTPSNEEYIVPAHYNAVHNPETEMYYPNTNNTSDVSQLNAYYQNFNADLNTGYNIDSFACENFINDINIYSTQFYPSSDINLDAYLHPIEDRDWSANAFDLTLL